MKITKNTLEVETDRWEDPGDYPNALASGPLPSYDYISDVLGEVVIEFEDGDDEDDRHEDSLRDFLNDEVCVDGVSINGWNLHREDNKVVATVDEFDADPDYCLSY